MSVRVRFAPSPTGYLHIGGARTALYNYLYAKATGGTFILRIEDTDEARSTKEFEASQIADLKWLGIEYNEGPDAGGEYGPYRQSERLDLYKEHAEKLVNEGKAYYCFCSDEVLDAKREKAEAENQAPHYDGTCRDIPLEEARERIAAGETATVRFKVPKKDYVLNDVVRREVTFPDGMVGDFVIMRSTGLPVYNFCCVVDDYLMKITHVIRGEDHLANTLRQLMIYEALDAPLPTFAHLSLLVGEDRQKLSKRHGATSTTFYRENGYLPDAMTNYLCLLGWSHPEEKDIFKLDELKSVFTIDRFNKSPALYDTNKLNWVNGQHLKTLETSELVTLMNENLSKESPFHAQTAEWKEACVLLFKEKINLPSEMEPLIAEIFNENIEETEELKEIFSWETTPVIKEYLAGVVNELGGEFPTADEFSGWLNHVKKELKIKGKPLFMGVRGVLTGMPHGSDLKALIPLTPVSVLKKRLG